MRPLGASACQKRHISGRLRSTSVSAPKAHVTPGVNVRCRYFTPQRVEACAARVFFSGFLSAFLLHAHLPSAASSQES